ncbi:hypothetical protein AKJ09_03804 [Labilithrix luteola]|uniref:Uncharacterized protein n=1 Tax=Labilithrix luteola TaxID=1391654 RepID=A0A0K1PUC6_9BACT|nr:hypothetical protein AKJ09_03804 [Labilithrix luteola]
MIDREMRHVDMPSSRTSLPPSQPSDKVIGAIAHVDTTPG